MGEVRMALNARILKKKTRKGRISAFMLCSFSQGSIGEHEQVMVAVCMVVENWGRCEFGEVDGIFSRWKNLWRVLSTGVGANKNL